MVRHEAESDNADVLRLRRRLTRLLNKLAHSGRVRSFSGVNHAAWQFPLLAPLVKDQQGVALVSGDHERKR